MYLGELITNLEIEPDHEVDYGCGDCRRCLDACPTSCLIGDGTMNARRCLSFQTQDKGMMDMEFFEDKDYYSMVVTFVRFPVHITEVSTIPWVPDIDPELAMPELLPFLELTNKSFKEKFGMIAGSWRG